MRTLEHLTDLLIRAIEAERFDRYAGRTFRSLST